MADIGVLGCGWLGRPLAAELVRRGYSVHGSTTSVDKLPLLEEAGIVPFLIDTHADFSDAARRFWEVRTLIITVPPKKGAYRETFPSLIAHIKKAGIRQVLFCSSISVYGKATGLVDETTPLQPDTGSARDIVDAERLLRENLPDTTVLRFGGLVGPERHPITYLAGRKDIPDGDAPINLVHLEDCIGSIFAILTQDHWGKTYNIVPPFHPSKKDYYVQKAEEFGLPAPTFLDGGAEHRIVDGSRISRDSGYGYRVTASL